MNEIKLDEEPLAIAARLLQADARAALRDLDFEELRGKRVLVTGASGFIGTHMIAGLLEMRRQMGGQLSISAVTTQQMPVWIRFMDRENEIDVYQGDLTDANFVGLLPEFDTIIHAATYGQPKVFAAIQDKTLKLNTVTTFSLLDKVREGGKFLFLSSSEVYGGCTTIPFREEEIGTTNTTHPRACYIEGKRCGEAICNAYRARGIDAKAVRICHGYGPGVRSADQRVMSSFIEMALRDGRIALMDSGFAIRNYCYISDMGRMLWPILFHGREVIYNVGGEYRTTIAELATTLGKMMNVDVVFPRDESRSLQGASPEVQVSIEKFEKEFGKLSFVTPKSGLQSTIAWHEMLGQMKN